MTIEEIAALQREYLKPKDIAPILGCSQYTINIQVKEDKEHDKNSFPFPTILLGSRVLIPKRAFIAAMTQPVHRLVD